MAEAQQLVERYRAYARDVARHAHAPYSGYRVGAVLVGQRGETWAGCNMESASYGLTQCAERNALAGAVADGMVVGSATAMLIYLPGDRALPPCGACRQVMVELMAPAARVVSCCDGDEMLEWQMDELLPRPFLPDQEA